MEKRGMAQTQSETQQVAAAQTGKGASSRSPNESKSNRADPKNGPGTASDTDPTEMLKSDHRHVEELFTSSRSRYDDDDDERRGGRGHGGWYGVPEGHSEASRRGRR
jgi:hypothetical protein